MSEDVETEVRTIETQPGERGATGYMENDNASLAKSDVFDPSSVLVQVLRRPSDTIARRLQEVLYLWVNAGVAYQPLEDAFGGWIDVARNWQTLKFKEQNRFKYLLLIDSDVSPPPDTPLMLARHNKPVVSGIVPAFNSGRGLFVCVGLKGPDGKARFPSLIETKKLPAEGLAEVDYVGAACLMIRGDVLDKIWDDFAAEMDEEATVREAILCAIEERPLTQDQRTACMSYMRRHMSPTIIGGQPFSIPEKVRREAAKIGIMPKGEDICFSERTRSAGFKIYADFSVRCYHEKLMTLAWPKEAIDPRLDVELWRKSAFPGMPVIQGR